MRRLSPQDIDREVTEQIEADPLLRSACNASLSSSAVPRHPQTEFAMDAATRRRHSREGGTRHGPMPTLEDMERQMR